MCKTRLSPAESYPGARQLTTAYQVAIDSLAIGTKTDKLSHVCLSVGRLTPFSASSYQPPASNHFEYLLAGARCPDEQVSSA